MRSRFFGAAGPILALCATGLLLLSGCGAEQAQPTTQPTAQATAQPSAQPEQTQLVQPTDTSSSTGSTETLIISAIPDQDPEKLQRLYGTVASYLSKELGVPVEYKAVTDYTASVTGFKVGDLDLVWYGGLTGVQSRL